MMSSEEPDYQPLDLPHSPWGANELLQKAVSDDEREWIPTVRSGVWLRPLLFDTVNGSWVNIVRMRTEGLISRHHHPSPVHGYIIKGRWRYLERDWIAEAGDYLYEPAGDTHTLWAEPGESLTMFTIHGCLIELDEAGKPISSADVFTRIEQATTHYEAVGLGADYVKRFIR
jgi:quercetin dioxygenase-like cupin family protein